MQVVNDPRPWWGMMPGAPLSIVDLIANGTVSAAGAAALWWAVERGASVFVAAAPRLAGKTTLATALLSFLPHEARAYVTDGPYDPLDVPRDDAPTYLLINELSDHTPYYLAGPAARGAFALVRDGMRVIGTLHADSAAEAVAVMHYESGVPLVDIARVTLIVVLRVRRATTGVERRVVQVGLLQPSDGGIEVVEVAGWDATAGRLAIRDTPAGIAALGAWAGKPAQRAGQEVDTRAEFLTDQWRRGVHTWDDVGAAVRWFRRNEQGSHAQA